MKPFTQPFCFHIGYHRTGTTFLQRFILPQCSDSRALLPDALAQPIKQLLLHDRAMTVDEQQALRTYLAACDTRVFLSNEGLSGDMYRDDLDMAEKIRRYFPDSRIVVTLRSQYTVIASLYQFLYIKAGGKGSYADYIELVTRNDKWNYFELVTRYVEVFGEGTVKVLLFEDLVRDRDRYLREFLQAAGLPTTFESRGGGEHRNPRPGVLEARLGRISNSLLADDSMIAKVLPRSEIVLRKVRGRSSPPLRALASLGARLPYRPRAFEDDPACRSLIAAHYAAGNRKLQTLLRLDLADYPR